MNATSCVAVLHPPGLIPFPFGLPAATPSVLSFFPFSFEKQFLRKGG